MAYTLNNDTDLEMTRYNEAARIKAYSGVSINNVRGGYVVSNPNRNTESVYIDLPSGGRMRVGDRLVTPKQMAETDAAVAAAVPASEDIDTFSKNFKSDPSNIGGKDPSFDDYDMAGYSQAEILQYEKSRNEQYMAQPNILNAMKLTPDQIAQYAQQPGAEMAMPRETGFGESSRDLVYNTLDPNREPTGAIGDAISSALQSLIGQENLDDPSDVRAFAKLFTDFADVTVPGYSGTATVDEGARTFNSGYKMIIDGIASGDTNMMKVGAIDAAIGIGLTTLGVAEFVPLVSSLTDPAKNLFREASPFARNMLADAIGTSRAIAQGDKDMLMEIFQPAGTPRSLGAAAVDGTGAIQGGLPGRISTRFPTAMKAEEDPMTGTLVVGLEELKKEPKLFDYNVGITRDYPNMRPAPNATTEETAEQFITHVKDNLLYLHDQVPEATRTRSQLWYDGARNITERWSKDYGVPDTSIAGALAALSPQKDWYQNVSLAERVLDVIKPKGNTPTSFTPEMEATFRGIESLNKPKYEPLLQAIKGKSYNEITDPDPAVQNTLRALFVRLHDQTYKIPDYRVVSPEGDFLDVARNADGSASRVAWGSLNEIGKAIGAIESNGDVNTISRLMGERHKVRNFYNNIYDPNSPYGDVTIDTHAVAAGLMRPLSGNSLEVDHNFKNISVAGRGTTKGSSTTGMSGNYGLYAEAYRRAAAERGILPRQMQSITWEAVRGLFPDTFKTAKNAADIDAIWTRYRNGEIEIDEARSLVGERAGGIRPPTWEQQ